MDSQLKALNTREGDRFGSTVSISFDGRGIFVGAPLEDGLSIGLGGDPFKIGVSEDRGAGFLFEWREKMAD